MLGVVCCCQKASGWFRQSCLLFNSWLRHFEVFFRGKFRFLSLELHCRCLQKTSENLSGLCSQHFIPKGTGVACRDSDTVKICSAGISEVGNLTAIHYLVINAKAFPINILRRLQGQYQLTFPIQGRRTQKIDTQKECLIWKHLGQQKKRASEVGRPQEI